MPSVASRKIKFRLRRAFTALVRVSGRSDLEANRLRGNRFLIIFSDFIFANYFTVVSKGEYKNVVSWASNRQLLWSSQQGDVELKVELI